MRMKPKKKLKTRPTMTLDEEDENDEDNTQNIVYPEEDNSIKYGQHS